MIQKRWLAYSDPSTAIRNTAPHHQEGLPVNPLQAPAFGDRRLRDCGRLGHTRPLRRRE